MTLHHVDNATSASEVVEKQLRKQVVSDWKALGSNVLRAVGVDFVNSENEREVDVTWIAVVGGQVEVEAAATETAAGQRWKVAGAELVQPF